MLGPCYNRPRTAAAPKPLTVASALLTVRVSCPANAETAVGTAVGTATRTTARTAARTAARTHRVQIGGLSLRDSL